jgi:hypothetical protein
MTAVRRAGLVSPSVGASIAWCGSLWLSLRRLFLPPPDRLFFALQTLTFWPALCRLL